MATPIFERYRVVDIDTHVTEPADVWTDRVARKWGERVPHIRRIGDLDLWMVGDQPIGMPGAYSMAGAAGTPPDFRKNYDEIPPSMYDARGRASRSWTTSASTPTSLAALSPVGFRRYNKSFSSSINSSSKGFFS